LQAETDSAVAARITKKPASDWLAGKSSFQGSTAA
jgi:hypothetical protein